MNSTDRKKLRVWIRRVPCIAAIALFLLGAIQLMRPPWFDEVLTLGWLTLGFAKIPFTYPIPNNHIVYTMLLSLWNSAGGEFAPNWIAYLRLLSLLTGCGALWLVSRELLRRCGASVGFICSMLLASSSAFAVYSTALRGYMAAFLFTFAAFLAAERWRKSARFSRWGVLYLLFCYLAVGVMPTALFALLAGTLFFASDLRKAGCRVRWFALVLIPVLSVPLFYAHIFGKLVAASNLREGWTGYGAAYGNLYLAFAVTVLPLLPFAAAGAWRMRRQRFRLLSFALIFAMPLLLAVPAKAPPFPRIFFPFFGLWMLMLGILASRSGRTGRRLILVSLLWIVFTANFTPQISRCLFGPPYADDLLNPYPVSAEFQPVKAAEAIRGEAEPVFIDFDADPPSLKFVLTNLGFAEERILYDRPDFGKVVSLPPDTCIVCRSAADLEKVKTRFALNQEYEEIFSSGMQKVYRPK